MNEDKRILNLVSEGLCPSQIATQCQLPTAEVVKQLSVAVNEGRLKRSDVLATFDKDWGFWVDGMMLFLDNPTHPRVKATMEKMGFKCDTEDLKLYLAYKGIPVQAGDLYEMLSYIEKTLHAFIKVTLVKEYGGGENEWWGQGITKNVRQDCVRAREESMEYHAEPYGFTTFIHLAEIIKDKWALFVNRLPKSMVNDKTKLLGELRRVNGIRNQVMHPVRGDAVNVEDFEFIKALHREIIHISQPK